MFGIPFDLILTLISVIVFFIFTRNLITTLFRMEHEGIKNKRLKSLNFDGSRIGQSDEEGTREFLHKVSDPVIRYILPHFRFKNNEQINQDLDFIGWGKYIQAEQFRALTIIMRALGVIVLLVLWGTLWPAALLLGSTLILGLPFFLKMDVDEKKAEMVSEFPEIIRLTQGYLAADQSLTDSFERTLPYVAKNWQPVIEEYVKNARTKNEREALDIMKDSVNIPEVKELLSLIRLSMDQGTDLFNAFENQHEKVRAMKLNAMMKKIHNRKNMAILVQFPILLMIFVALGLPTFNMVMNM